MGARQAALIITADDFGLHASVNRAVERAHREGVLSTASLMVGEAAALDAVSRARACPGLRVGLHLVLADGRSTLPTRAIPDLVDRDGRFGQHMARDGVRFFCLPRVRRQLAQEIRAQFEAFAATGLALDHVNAHKHFHLHPTVLTLVLGIGIEFGLRAVRLPIEPGTPPWLRPWLGLMRARLRAAGVHHNDELLGIRASGRFDEPALLAALDSMLDSTLQPIPGKGPRLGIRELYLHPALDSGTAIAESMAGYRHADEFAALVSPRVREACALLAARGVRFGGYGDVTWPR